MKLSTRNRGATGRWAAGIFAACAFAAAISSGSAAQIDRADQVVRISASGAANPAVVSPGSATQHFDDAPYGVDPMVTGPVSAAFKLRQEAARCDEMVWPNIPAACYPD